MLGLKPGASFDEVQQARNKRISEVADDPILKAKIEASYDALLMGSLKARQLGRVSNEAASASNKEKEINDMGSGLRGSLLTRIGGFGFSSQKKNEKGNGMALNLGFPDGQGLTIRLALGLLALVLVLTSPDESIQVILSFSTIGLFISQVKRGRGLFQSLGWSVVFLSLGLILGGLVVSGIANTTDQVHSFSPDKIEGLTAILSIWLGALLFS